MSKQVDFVIRPARADDHAPLLSLGARLSVGPAPWRDVDKVTAAACGWIEASAWLSDGTSPGTPTRTSAS